MFNDVIQPSLLAIVLLLSLQNTGSAFTGGSCRRSPTNNMFHRTKPVIVVTPTAFLGVCPTKKLIQSELNVSKGQIGHHGHFVYNYKLDGAKSHAHCLSCCFRKWPVFSSFPLGVLLGVERVCEGSHPHNYEQPDLLSSNNTFCITFGVIFPNFRYLKFNYFN